MNVAVVGATGYTGIELVKYLSSHPHFDIKKIFSSSQYGARLADLEPSLDGICKLSLEALNSENLLKDSSISAFFLCQPHGTSFEFVKKLVEAGKIVIDLSADFRFSNSKLYEKTYNVTHPYPELLEKRVYGIPEIFRSDIVNSNLIANPGCYPTSIIIPLYPLIEKKLIELDNIIVDSKSGISGAGKKPNPRTHFCEINENISAYNLFSHRHGPEIKDTLSRVCPHLDLTFTPHLIPITRGIESTIYLQSTVSLDSLFNALKEYYRDSFFVRIYKERYLSVKDVSFTNFINISLFKEGNRFIILSFIDNLIKGASGQAIQNLNIRAGLDEKSGLI